MNLDHNHENKHSCDALMIKVAARGSKLSQIQVWEVHKELISHTPNVIFDTILVKTTGDKDLKTSLKTLSNSNFFSKEIDEMILRGEARIGIHSAKDLPSPLPHGLSIVALTKGLDPADSLVLRPGVTLETLPQGAKIATSSLRREHTIIELIPHATLVDIRGTIEQRLEKLDMRSIDGVVVAECALIRLGLTHLNRIKLPGATAHGQGKLAVVARSDDKEMKKLFALLDASR